MAWCKGCRGPLTTFSKTGYCKKQECFSEAMKEAHKQHKEAYKRAAKLASDTQIGRTNVGRSTKNFKNIGRPRKKRQDEHT